MEIRFVSVKLPEITDTLVQHLSTLPSPVDTFFESHVEGSSHYSIRITGAEAGYTSIHGGSMITQFCLHEPFKRFGQRLFQRIKKMESVQRAFVPTCDEFFLSHALDEYSQMAKQAYFFQAGGFQASGSEDSTTGDGALSFRQAEAKDVELIRQMSGDFVDPIEERVQRGELFLTNKGNECAGIGLLIQNNFCLGHADIGMFTAESFRHSGIGTATIRFLIQECRRQQKQPVAGCAYYNHLSKQTLEKAGMYAQTRLLKIGY